ncbi:MAG: HEAT repeat domain-containing protein [Thermotaleaceae bacterium]
MKDKREKDLSWQHIQEGQDHLISYLLYKEGKDVHLIAKIRRLSIEEINHHLIQAKWEVFYKGRTEKTLLERLIELDKGERKNILASMPAHEKRGLAKEILNRYGEIDHSEDKMLMIWLIGELGLGGLLKLVYGDVQHPHGNVRRLACSAIGKVGNESSLPYLHKALLDAKPQVRQYAAKALGKLGNKETILKIQYLLHNPREKDYVKRAFEEAIDRIEGKLEKS